METARARATRSRAVRRAYAVAHGWEHASALRETQRAAIGELGTRARDGRGRALGKRAARDGTETATREGGEGEAGRRRRRRRRRATTSGKGREDAMKGLTTAHAFYAWYADVEETMDEARRRARRREADALRAEIREARRRAGKIGGGGDEGSKTLVGRAGGAAG